MEASHKEAIRLLANQGAADFRANRYQEALAKFQRAYETARVPRLLVWIAKTQVKLGRLVDAYESYRQAVSLEKSDLWIGTTQQEAQQEAQQELLALQTRVARLTVRVQDANLKDVSLRIDDLEVPSSLIGVERFADPGHRLIVARVGNTEERSEVDLAEGDRKEVTLTFTKQATARAAVMQPTPGRSVPQEPSRGESAITQEQSTTAHGKGQKTWGWVSLGVGAAGAVLGSVTGVMVVAQHDKLVNNCPGHQCGPAYASDSDRFDTLRLLSTVGFVVAGVGAAAGVTLLLTSPKNPAQPNVGLWLAPASVGARGTF